MFSPLVKSDQKKKCLNKFVLKVRRQISNLTKKPKHASFLHAQKYFVYLG